MQDGVDSAIESSPFDIFADCRGFPYPSKGPFHSPQTSATPI